MILSLSTSLAAMPVPVPLNDICFDQAAAAYGVSPALLRAVALQESSLDPAAIHLNSDGSRDIGLMQINSRWLRFLGQHDVREADLFEPCTNLHVAAWILAGNFRRLGTNWQAVGAYNARTPELRAHYAARVLTRLRKLLRGNP